MEKVSLPKGTRDFGPAQMAKRQFIIDSIKKVFQNYGFQPLETPAMENLSTLTGKYGEEGDKLLFKVLDSGDYPKNLVQSESFKESVKISSRDQTFAKIFLRTFHALELALERLSKWVFTSSIESRDPKEISKLIASENDFFFNVFLGLPLESKEKSDLYNFIKQNDIQIANSLIDFYLNASVYGVNYEEKHSTQFHQYLENILIPLFSDTLNEFLVQKNLEVLMQKNSEILMRIPSKQITTEISEKGLRYDLTVPFARYVVMNRHEITFPFKRYQIQPVWRADRPQKGRYREFYQCDADVVGTDSLVCEAEIILMIKDAFRSLGILDYSIKINHRAILSGLAEIIGAGENESSLFVAIDKLDKIGEEKVKEELRLKNFSEKNLALLFEILNFKGNTKRKIDFLTQKFSSSEKGKKGLSDFNEVLTLLKGFGANEDHVEFDIALARGLSYYTGCIFEVKINNVGIGSVSGGGRYDNLTAVFDAKEKSSGVGFSFGIDRIYDAMEELKIFPRDTGVSSKVLVAHLDEASFHYGLKIIAALREKEIACEIYPDHSKIKKQMEYADKKKTPFVIVIGPEEVETEIFTIKNMETGNQLKLSLDEITTAMRLYK